jgi:[ribosomal protein S5]-alanine N-acetyltransferase
MTNHPGWPARLTAGPITLRPPRLLDARAWSEVRLRNENWLDKWEPSSPYTWADRNSPGSWPHLNSALRKAARRGTMLPTMLYYGPQLAGQLNVSNIVHGVQRSCTVGYWIDSRLAGRGVVPAALALLMDHCLTEVGMHRIEIDIRPENTASLRVVEKLGLRREGYYERYLDIDGAWRDHVAFAVTVEELDGHRLLSRVPLPAEPPPPVS